MMERCGAGVPEPIFEVYDEHGIKLVPLDGKSQGKFGPPTRPDPDFPLIRRLDVRRIHGPTPPSHAYRRL